MDIFAPDVVMVVLTWVTFFSLLVILKKFAWAPILENLKKREDEIQASLKNADDIKSRLSQVDQIKTEILEQAKVEAARIINESRKAASDLAHDIEVKSKTHAQAIIASAQSVIDGEYQRARDGLRKDSVEISILLSSKIIKENMDTQKNRQLVQEAVKQI